MTAALDYSTEDNTLLAGRVVTCDGPWVSVALEDHRRSARPRRLSQLSARRAASCLLAPQPGDRVLLTLMPEPFVLAVLERSGDRPAELVFEGDASIKAGGRLALGGREGVSVSSGRELSLFARLLDLKAAEGKIAFERVSAVARAAQTHVQKLSVFAEAYDLFAERVAQRSKRVYRFVEELDQLRARHFDYRAEHTAQIRGETTVVTARQVIKVDGEQVHIG